MVRQVHEVWQKTRLEFAGDVSRIARAVLAHYRGMAQALAHIWRLDGLAVAMSNYVATGADIDLVKPYKPLIQQRCRVAG